jgi:hypothetical protein
MILLDNAKVQTPIKNAELLPESLRTLSKSTPLTIHYLEPWLGKPVADFALPGHATPLLLTSAPGECALEALSVGILEHTPIGFPHKDNPLNYTLHNLSSGQSCPVLMLTRGGQYREPVIWAEDVKPVSVIDFAPRYQGTSASALQGIEIEAALVVRLKAWALYPELIPSQYASDIAVGLANAISLFLNNFPLNLQKALTRSSALLAPEYASQSYAALGMGGSEVKSSSTPAIFYGSLADAAQKCGIRESELSGLLAQQPRNFTRIARLVLPAYIEVARFGLTPSDLCR